MLLPHHFTAFLADTQWLFCWEYSFVLRKDIFPVSVFLPFFPLFFPPFTFLPTPPPLLCFFLCRGEGYFLNRFLLLLFLFCCSFSTIFLLQPPMCWDFKWNPRLQAFTFFFFVIKLHWKEVLLFTIRPKLLLQKHFNIKFIVSSCLTIYIKLIF